MSYFECSSPYFTKPELKEQKTARLKSGITGAFNHSLAKSGYVLVNECFNLKHLPAPFSCVEPHSLFMVFFQEANFQHFYCHIQKNSIL